MSQSINNRKLILELRYDPITLLLDHRGEFSDFLQSISYLDCKAWKISSDTVEVFDSESQNKITKRVFAGINRLSFIDEYALEDGSFYATFEEILKKFNELTKSPTIRRVGCRVMGTYSPSSSISGSPVPKFLDLLKDDAIIKDFPVRDVNMTITYSTGRYTIGPIRKEDNWVKQNFLHDKKIEKAGFAVDTDNFIVDNNTTKGISISEIKNIYETSLEVEKTLCSKLSNIYE